ncbi:MAG: hypothetical protein V8R27_04515 [Oscillospiraceae bacterium]
MEQALELPAASSSRAAAAGGGLGREPGDLSWQRRWAGRLEEIARDRTS